MEYKNIIISIEDGIALIKLNRPKALNALSKEMVNELDQAFADMENDPDVRAVVITGDKNFAAGADIVDMVNMNPEQARAFSFRHTFGRIEQFPKPVIAAMPGFALGGGLELALVCDWRIAGPDARLGLPEINLGIFPGAGGTLRLPRLIGMTRAKQMIFSGAMINAQQALEWGLVNAIAEDPLEEAMKVARMLAAKAPVALKLAKQCVNLAFDTDMANGVEFEALAWSSTFATRDQKEGMQAFLEKRKPNFTGE